MNTIIAIWRTVEFSAENIDERAGADPTEDVVIIRQHYLSLPHLRIDIYANAEGESCENAPPMNRLLSGIRNIIPSIISDLMSTLL